MKRCNNARTVTEGRTVLMRQQPTSRIFVGLDITANQVLTDQIRIMQMSTIVIVHPLEDTRVINYTLCANNICVPFCGNISCK